MQNTLNQNNLANHDNKQKTTITERTDDDLHILEQDPAKKSVLKSVLRTLGFLETNLRHPSLQTHEFTALTGPDGEKVFEAYAQQKTPRAYRVFWCYGPQKNELTIIAITAHPNKSRLPS